MKVAISFNSGTMTIVEAASVEIAIYWARWEFGNSNVRSGKEATDKELDWHLVCDGIIQQAVAIPLPPDAAMLEALKDQEEFWYNAGSGVDLDADPDDDSPEDMFAHTAGLAVRAIRDAIAQAQKAGREIAKGDNLPRSKFVGWIGEPAEASL